MRVCVYIGVFILEIFIGYGKYKLINLPQSSGHTTNNNNMPCIHSGELYFSIYFVAVASLRAPKMRRYIFRIGQAHVFEISKLLYVFSQNVEKKWNENEAEEKRRSGQNRWSLIQTECCAKERKNGTVFRVFLVANALQCLTMLYEPQLQFKMSKKLMKFVQWLLSFSTNIFCSGCVRVSMCVYIGLREFALKVFGRKIESISHAREP